jgi:ubiquinone/menaquinone biosynthesis C-methylase UbiE
MADKPNLPAPSSSDPKADQDLGRRFGSEAQLYDALRPGYQDELFSHLVEVTGLPENASVLEIGVGTGQATMPMAQRGYSLTGIELSDELAQLARQKLDDFPSATVVTGTFEDAVIPDESFDLVYSATAFHWIQPEVKFAKPHRILKPGGFLAIIINEPVRDSNGNRFFTASNPIFEKHGITQSDLWDRTVRDLKPQEIDNELFERVGFYVTDPPNVHSYQSAQEYSDYLRTLSFVLKMPEEEREPFLREVHDLLVSEFDSRLDTYYSPTLDLLRKK